MADGVGYTPGVGANIATDDIGGFQYQRIKPVWGADGIATDTSPVNPLPVALGASQRYFANAYERVAASQTAQVLGTGLGATGDYIAGVLVIPATTSPGAVTLLDGGTSMVIFTGGASSVSNLVPFYVPLGMVSQNGPWKLTTGAAVSCIGMGAFT
jgi:hypothetical protein